MMGIGNLTELTDVDSAGINTLLLGFCQETGIRSVLTTEVIHWATSSVRECSLARALVHHAVENRTLPKHVEPRLVTLRGGKPQAHGPEALAALARAAYKTLGLQSYFTAGEKEVRAWTIPIGTLAPQAAGVIHTDFEKGFIRAEIYSLEDLEQYKTEKDIRAHGKLRVEGKDYEMRDGDICHFLVNK